MQIDWSLPDNPESEVVDHDESDLVRSVACDVGRTIKRRRKSFLPLSDVAEIFKEVTPGQLCQPAEMSVYAPSKVLALVESVTIKQLCAYDALVNKIHPRGKGHFVEPRLGYDDPLAVAASPQPEEKLSSLDELKQLRDDSCCSCFVTFLFPYFYPIETPVCPVLSALSSSSWLGAFLICIFIMRLYPDFVRPPERILFEKFCLLIINFIG